MTSSRIAEKITSVSLPAVGVHQVHGDRREQELAERAGRRHRAERDVAPAFRQELAERADHHRHRRARQAQADQDAGGQMQHLRRRRARGEIEPERIEDDADAQHPRRAVFVGDRAGERLAETPQQVLQGERQREHVAAPAVRLRQRREEEAERRARPERQDRDRASRTATRMIGVRHENDLVALEAASVMGISGASANIGRTRVRPNHNLVKASIRERIAASKGNDRQGLAEQDRTCYIRFARNEDNCLSERCRLPPDVFVPYICSN